MRARSTLRRQARAAGLRSCTSNWFHHDGARAAPALPELGAVATLIEAAGFQLRFIPCRWFLGPFEQLDRMTRHDRRDCVLVDELRMPVATQQHAEIIKPCHNALQLDSVNKEDRERSLALSNMVQEGVL